MAKQRELLDSICVFSFVAQAPGKHGFSFDLLSLFLDFLGPPEVDVGRCQVSDDETLYYVYVGQSF